MKETQTQIEDKFNEFRDRTESSIYSIQQMLKEPRLNKLFTWLLTADSAAYSFLPVGWRGSISTASDAESLLRVIYNAVLDDGEISFVTVGDEPRIVFEDVRFMDNEELNRMVLCPTTEKFSATKKEIKILHIEPNEFVDCAIEYTTKKLQKCFVSDAAALGLDFAVKHYSEYKLFSESWSTTLKQKIDDLAKARSKLLL
jgi:hypothetical protein